MNKPTKLLLRFKELIDQTGGLTQAIDADYGVMAPAADPEWIDLGDFYSEVCAFLSSCEKDYPQLVVVHYGGDTGLVSISERMLLSSTWSTNHYSYASEFPRVAVTDSEMLERLGDDHQWSDVINMIAEHYDWDKKELTLPAPKTEE